MVVFDFNSSLNFCQNTFASTLKGLANAYRTHCLLTTIGFSTQAPTRHLYPPLSRQSSSSDIFLFRPVSLHDVCANNISPESSRYRNMSADDAVKAVSLRYSREGITEHTGEGKRNSRLAYLCGLRASFNCQSTDALCQRRFRRSTEPGCLCSRFDNHRFVFDAVSMGQIPSAQGRRQGAYAYGPARLCTVFHLHYRRQNARCKHSRRDSSGASCAIHNGSWLPRLCTSVHFHSKSLFLHNTGKKQFRLYPHTFINQIKSTDLRCDQTIRLNGFYVSQDYPAVIRRIGFFDTETNKKFVFLTNNFTLPSLTITKLFKCRWQIEIFFKWIKQYLRIKTFFGTSANAVKTQIWIAISVYLLVAIVKKELGLEQSLGEILQILSIVLFEQMPIEPLLTDNMSQNDFNQFHNQLSLFDL